VATRVRVAQSNISTTISNTDMVSRYSTGVSTFLTAEEPYMGVSANQTQDRHSSRDSRAGLYLMKCSAFTTESRLLFRINNKTRCTHTGVARIKNWRWEDWRWLGHPGHPLATPLSTHRLWISNAADLIKYLQLGLSCSGKNSIRHS